MVFDDQESVRDGWQQEKHGYSYGLYGTPTSLELAARITHLEGAHNSFIVPGGQHGKFDAEARKTQMEMTVAFLEELGILR